MLVLGSLFNQISSHEAVCAIGCICYELLALMSRHLHPQSLHSSSVLMGNFCPHSSQLTSCSKWWMAFVCLSNSTLWIA